MRKNETKPLAGNKTHRSNVTYCCRQWNRSFTAVLERIREVYAR